MKNISEFALMTFKGIKSKTVEKIFPEIIIKAENLKKENKKCYYVGIKNTNVISIEFIKKLEKLGLLHHTLDYMSKGGRAIDINFQNPITGRLMTGSSSATAINVFLGINDIGIGTDGGGSVLAPALSVNLYGFISNLFDKNNMIRFKKESTDGITFSPSIGILSKNIDNLEYVISNILIEGDLESKNDIGVKIANPIIQEQNNFYEQIKEDLEKYSLRNVSLSYKTLDRKFMIEELKGFDFDNNILITFEGPIDFYEYGDSIMGHYSEYTKRKQALAHKYYLKVINMLNLSAFAIPSSDLSLGALIICKSEIDKIRFSLEIVKSIKFKRSELEENYFN